MLHTTAHHQEPHIFQPSVDTNVHGRNHIHVTSYDLCLLHLAPCLSPAHPSKFTVSAFFHRNHFENTNTTCHVHISEGGGAQHRQRSL